jgi:hypothetical protein
LLNLIEQDFDDVWGVKCEEGFLLMIIIIWTRHSEERQKEWQKKLGITRQEVEQMLTSPEQIVSGDQGAWVAQSRKASDNSPA